MESPITGKVMSYNVRRERITIKGIRINYIHESYYCKDSDNYFTSTTLDEKNLKRAIHSYDKKVNKELPSYWWAIAIILIVSLFILLHN